MIITLRYKLIMMGLGLLCCQFVSAARCKNVDFTYATNTNYYDVTNKPVGTELFNLSDNVVVTGTCTRTSAMNGQNLNIVWGRSSPPATCTNVAKTVYSSDGYLKMTANMTCGGSSWLMASDKSKATSGTSSLSAPSSKSDAGIITLNKIPPLGKTKVTNLFWRGVMTYSRIGNKGNTEQSEPILIRSQNYVTLFNKFSCGVSVNDVDFGSQTINALKTNAIQSKIIELKFNCNGRLPVKGYSLRFSGVNGAYNINDGIIRAATNNTAGFRLTWDGAEVATAGTPVVLNNTAYYNKNAATSNSFSVVIRAKPRALDSVIKAGPVQASLLINITLN